MNTYRVIFSVLVIFIVVSIFAVYASIETYGWDWDKDKRQQVTLNEEDVEEPTTSWYEFYKPAFWQERVMGVVADFTGTSLGSLIGVPGLGLLMDVSAFGLADMPVAVQAIFWVLGAIFAIAVIRVVVGTVLGDAG